MDRTSRRATVVVVLALALLTALLAPGIAARASAGPAARSLAPATGLPADCHVQEVTMTKVWTSIGHEHVAWHRKAHATVKCTTTPREYNSQIRIEKREGGKKAPIKWVPVGYAPPHHTIPHPYDFSWLYMPCTQGYFRAQIGIWGTSSTGRVQPEIMFTSKVLKIVNCTIPPGHPHVSLMSFTAPRLADCGWPNTGMGLHLNDAGIWMLRPNGREQCQRHPREIHMQLDLQKELADGWHYVGFGPVRHGLDGSLGRTMFKDFHCRENIYRVGWFIWGTSSTGVVDPGHLYCSGPLLVGGPDSCLLGRPPRPDGWRHKTHRCTPPAFDPPVAPRALPATVRLMAARGVRPADSIFGCGVSVKMRLVMIQGRSMRQAYTKLSCTTAPGTFRARIAQQRRKSGKWVTVAQGRWKSDNPFPFRYYWLNRGCSPGVYRAKFTATGTNSAGIELSHPVDFFSKRLDIRECVSGGVLPLLREVLA